MKTTKPTPNAEKGDLDVLCGGYCDVCKNPFEGTKHVITDRYIGLHYVAFCSVTCYVEWLREHDFL